MGIAGLHTFLQAYGKTVQFKPGDDRSVVIDGPALAYNVWRENRLLEGDYRKFAKLLERFVQILRDVAGLQIEVVYFDGSLPIHKRDIRYARAIANLDRVKRNQGSLSQNTPPPPFVVPLAQDVLNGFGVPIEVIDEEADTACARHVKKIAQIRECYLLSLDSDMYCFDIGTRGYYLPCDGLLYTDNTFTGRVYNFHEIQSALGIDLIQLVTLVGTEGSLEASRSASESFKLLKTADHNISTLVEPDEIKRVRNQFSVRIELQAKDQGHMRLTDHGCIYGRVAEGCLSGEFWLPQLLEDCTKSSAWTPGLIYRASAYRSLREQGRVRQETISEWIRRADRISGRVIDVGAFEPVAVNESGSVHAVFVETMRTLILSCEQDKKRMSQNECYAFIVMIIGTISSNHCETTMTMLHLTARYQATVFSIIMLLQASGTIKWPLISQMYDIQTFLSALTALQSGASIQDLTRGHEGVVTDLITRIGWKSHKAMKKEKRKTRV